MTFDPGSGDVEGEMGKVLDEALETLRWARQHLAAPRASERLRELEARLGYLAQALSWQAAGAAEDAERALGLAQGRSLREQQRERQRWEQMWWSH